MSNVIPFKKKEVCTFSNEELQMVESEFYLEFRDCFIGQVTQAMKMNIEQEKYTELILFGIFKCLVYFHASNKLDKLQIDPRLNDIMDFITEKYKSIPSRR